MGSPDDKIKESGRDVELSASISLIGFDPALSDFWILLKPRLMSLALFVALVGLVAAPVDVHPLIGLVSVLCIAAGAGAAGALNMWYDADIDAIMRRTAHRPIPMGRIAPEQAAVFGFILGGGSVFLLGVLVNWVAAGLLALCIFFYIAIYTVWLKRRTLHNVVIGGISGAMPPLIGWAAATGKVDFGGLALFAIIFVWTPPHSWALALFAKQDYERAGVPMLPVVAGSYETRVWVLFYSALLLPVGMVPWFMGFAGSFFAVMAFILGSLFLFLAIKLFWHREGEKAKQSAKHLFFFSIIYLSVLYLVLLLEHVFGIVDS